MGFRHLFAVVLLLVHVAAFAQQDLSARDPLLNEGRLFMVTFTPASKQIVIGLAGRPDIELGPNQIKILGRTVSETGVRRKLEIKSMGDRFETAEKLGAGVKLELEIRENREDGRKETLILETP